MPDDGLDERSAAWGDDPRRGAGAMTGAVEGQRASRRDGGSHSETGPVKPGTPQDRVFGLLAGLMILVAVYLLVNSLIGTADVSEAPPGIELLAPSDGDTLSLPVGLRFRTAQPLSMQPGGWGASNFHLHVEVGGLELMPGATDIRPASGDEYLWTIASLPLGEATLRLFWADAAHRPVVGGASGAVRVVIR